MEFKEQWDRFTDALVKMMASAESLCHVAQCELALPECVLWLRTIGEYHDAALRSLEQIPRERMPNSGYLKCGRWAGISWTELSIHVGWFLRLLQPPIPEVSNRWEQDYSAFQAEPAGMHVTVEEIYHRLRSELRAHRLPDLPPADVIETTGQKRTTPAKRPRKSKNSAVVAFARPLIAQGLEWGEISTKWNALHRDVSQHRSGEAIRKAVGLADKTGQLT